MLDEENSNKENSNEENSNKEKGVSLMKDESATYNEAPVTEAAAPFDGEAALATETAPKKGNKNLIMGIVVLVIVGVVGMIAGPKLMANPLSKIVGAMGNTFSEMGALTSPMENASGVGAAFKTMNDGKTSLNANLSLVQAPTLYDGGSMDGLGMALQLDTDMPGKLFYMDTALLMEGTKIVNAEFYGSNENFDFAVPAVINGYFRMPLTNIGKAYKDSMFYQYQPIDVADDYSFSFFDVAETEGINKNYDAVSTKHKEFGKRLQKEITAEKTDSADMRVGEEMESCQGYVISMSDEKANAFLQDYITYWQTDEDAKALLDEAIKASAAQNGYSDYMSMAEMESELHNVMNEFFKMAKTIKLSDVSFNCYIDKKDIVRKFAFASVLSMEGDSVNLEFNGDFAGEERALDDTTLALNMAVEDEVLSMNFQNKQYNNGDNVVTEGSFIFGDKYTDAINGTWNFNYNTNDSGYSFDSDFKVDEEDGFVINSTGILEIPEKGKSFKLSMDNIDMSLSEYGDTTNVLLKGMVSLEPLNEAVKQASGTEYKFLELDEADLQSLVLEGYNNVLSLANELADIFN